MSERSLLDSTNTAGPLVSVVTCFYNPPTAYFREAIESVRAQTHRRWELFLVDSGTTDGSDAVAREYAATYDNIHFLRAPESVHSGPAASRNFGMRHASGELIAFIDADDFWLPDKLEQQVEAMQSHPESALIYGGILRWHDGAGEDQVEEHATELEVFPPRALIRRWLRNESIPGMSALMVRRSSAEAVGGFEQTLRWAEDQTISYKIALKHACLLLPGWKVKYRQHSQSTTTGVVASGAIFASHLLFLDWVLKYFTKARVSDAQLWSQLRQLHRQYRWLAFKQRWLPAFLRRWCQRGAGVMSPA